MLFGIVLFGVLLSLNNVALSVMIKILIDFAQKGRTNDLPHYIVLFAFLLLFQACVNSVQSIQQSRLSVSLSNHFREKIYDNLSKSDWQSFCKFHSDDIMTRLTSDIDLVASTITNTIPNIISLTVNIIAAMAVLLTYEPMLAVFAFLLGPAGVLFSKVWGKRIKKYHKRFQESEGFSREFLHENLQNMLIVKSFNLESYSKNHLKELHEKKLFYATRRATTSAWANMALYASYAAGYCLALCWGAYRIAESHGTFSFGTFSAFLQLVNQIQGPFSGLASSVSVLIQYHASSERLMDIDFIQMDSYQAISSNPVSFGIQLQNVDFAFDGHVVFQNACCKIMPNSITAIIGYSGEGKTTMLRLILALLHPQNGHVLVTDDINNSKIDVCPSTRKLISYVPQGNTLFSGTIRENLLFGCRDATDEKMIETLEAVCAWSFIKLLPDQLDSKIGEHGLSLSEGQAQRISIARALLRKSPLLILDEATSALDIETELNVLQAIKQANRTCILVTHRESPLSICDKILRVRNGTFEEVAFHLVFDKVQRM